jgi:hypothetical protein
VHRSGIARRALEGARERSRPLEAFGNGARPDRSDDVLALVVRDLARTWTKRDASEDRAPAMVRRSNPRVGSSRWKP